MTDVTISDLRADSVKTPDATLKISPMNAGNSESVRYPCAIVDICSSRSVRSGSVWIH